MAASSSISTWCTSARTKLWGCSSREADRIRRTIIASWSKRTTRWCASMWGPCAWTARRRWRHILAHQRVVLLLHDAIIVLLIRTAARELHPHNFVLPEVHQVLIEELAAIIRMQFADRERQSFYDATKSGFHGALPTPHHGHPFAPARGHIHQLDRVSVESSTTFPVMMHQIDLKMPWVADVPGNASHRHPFGDLVGPFGPFLRQPSHARTILA